MYYVSEPDPNTQQGITIFIQEQTTVFNPHLLLIILLTTCSLLAGTGDSTSADILTYQEYMALDVQPPYKVKLDCQAGKLCYIGVSHTGDPFDDQIRLIVSEWEAFKPDIVFSEGGVWPLELTMDEAVMKHGESGLLRFLAERDTVPIFSLELPDSELVRLLRRKFTAEQIKTFTVLQFVPQYFRFQTDEPFEVYVSRAIGSLNRKSGLEGLPRDMFELDASVRGLLPDLGDWRRVDTRWTSPLDSLSFLNEIARLSSRYRDEYMIDHLLISVQRGRKVFAVCGLAHVVMQEPVLRAGSREKQVRE